MQATAKTVSSKERAGCRMSSYIFKNVTQEESLHGTVVQGLSCNRVVAAELPSGRMAIKTSQVAHAVRRQAHISGEAPAGVLADPGDI